MIHCVITKKLKTKFLANSNSDFLTGFLFFRKHFCGVLWLCPQILLSWSVSRHVFKKWEKNKLKKAFERRKTIESRIKISIFFWGRSFLSFFLLASWDLQYCTLILRRCRIRTRDRCHSRKIKRLRPGTHCAALGFYIMYCQERRTHTTPIYICKPSNSGISELK